MPKLGFIGGGNMSSAVGHAVMKTGLYAPSDVWVSGPNLRNLSKWADLGANTTNANAEVVDNCDIIFLGVKPNMLAVAIEECCSKMYHSRKVFVSMLAGVTISQLIQVLDTIITDYEPLVIRIMPNTPMLISQGSCLFTPGPGVTQEQCSSVKKILEICGIVEQVKEEMIDSFGALTGCGPAFMYMIIEALSDGAVKQGVPRALATKFAAHMMSGSARMVLESGKHPGQLKDEVCSPGGSTICGVAELEMGGLRATLMKAIEASAKRTKELGHSSK